MTEIFNTTWYSWYVPIKNRCIVGAVVASDPLVEGNPHGFGQTGWAAEDFQHHRLSWYYPFKDPCRSGRCRYLRRRWPAVIWPNCLSFRRFSTAKSPDTIPLKPLFCRSGRCRYPRRKWPAVIWQDWLSDRRFSTAQSPDTIPLKPLFRRSGRCRFPRRRWPAVISPDWLSVRRFSTPWNDSSWRRNESNPTHRFS